MVDGCRAPNMVGVVAGDRDTRDEPVAAADLDRILRDAEELVAAQD
jgi:hypothetical protein